MAVVLETSVGNLTVDLYTNERPRCCLNFLKLCKIKYYNFSLFHSVQRDLVAQTGDPTGTGKGGASIFAKLYGDQAKYFDQELKPRIKHAKLGTVSMVNNGADMHGSQFFITLSPQVDYLDNVHTVFGEVTEGLEVLEKLNSTIVDKEHRPYKDIRMFHTVVLHDPFDDPEALADHIPEKSPLPTKEQLRSGNLGVDEDIGEFDGKSAEEIKEIIQGREAAANATVLEMIGNLPDADVAPPDNVLFVCKLNPVTTEEDLEIIFSRFGEIVSCEVIKDQKSGESLQYAFVEFDKPESCENAYFKMDNVLIDDRRIHVDFSQSVAKVKWKGKGKGVEHFKSDGAAEGRNYVIKDRSKRDNYELVLDDEEPAKKKKKKKSDNERGSGKSSSPGKKKSKHSHKKEKAKKSKH